MARELTHREQMDNQNSPVFAFFAAVAVVGAVVGGSKSVPEAKPARVTPAVHVVPAAAVAASAPKLR